MGTSGEMSTEQWTWWLALLRVEDTCLTDEAPLKHALCVANRPAAVKVRRDLMGTTIVPLVWIVRR